MRKITDVLSLPGTNKHAEGSFTILGCTAGTAGRLDATKEMNSTSQTEANATNCC